ncbi:MAG: hypothetical protein LC127_01775, partial [Chitinophagales bacterium]|nr:hypothetical protein [Chitinophagales bacterium]
RYKDRGMWNKQLYYISLTTYNCNIILYGAYNPKTLFNMNNDDMMKTLLRLREEIKELSEAIEKDNEDGYLLRPYVRRRYEDLLEIARAEERELLGGIYTEN